VDVLFAIEIRERAQRQVRKGTVPPPGMRPVTCARGGGRPPGPRVPPRRSAACACSDSAAIVGLGSVILLGHLTPHCELCQAMHFLIVERFRVTGVRKARRLTLTFSGCSSRPEDFACSMSNTATVTVVVGRRQSSSERTRA